VSDFETRFEELKASADTLEAEARNLGTWTCDPTPENTAWRERVERDLRECSEGLPVRLSQLSAQFSAGSFRAPNESSSATCDQSGILLANKSLFYLT
jgi:hypothetical protein